MKGISEVFGRNSRRTAKVLGSPLAFVAALAVVLAWAGTGPYCHYSDTWQLVINTGTTIVTFLMVFVIQNTQNRDSVAIHLKLDELIRSIKQARNTMIDLDSLTDEQLKTLLHEYHSLCEERRQTDD